MDLGTAGQWVSALAAIVAIVISIYAANSKRYEKRHDETIAGLRIEIGDLKGELRTTVAAMRGDLGRSFERVDKVEQGVATVENELRHLPDKDVVHSLQIAMTDLKGQMAVVIERVGPIKAIAERMQTVLLEHPTK